MHDCRRKHVFEFLRTQGDTVRFDAESQIHLQNRKLPRSDIQLEIWDLSLQGAGRGDRRGWHGQDDDTAFDDGTARSGHFCRLHSESYITVSEFYELLVGGLRLGLSSGASKAE